MTFSLKKGFISSKSLELPFGDVSKILKKTGMNVGVRIKHLMVGKIVGKKIFLGSLHFGRKLKIQRLMVTNSCGYSM